MLRRQLTLLFATAVLARSFGSTKQHEAEQLRPLEALEGLDLTINHRRLVGATCEEAKHITFGKPIHVKGTPGFTEGWFGPIKVTARKPSMIRAELSASEATMLDVYESTLGSICGNHTLVPNGHEGATGSAPDMTIDWLANRTTQYYLHAWTESSSFTISTRKLSPRPANDAFQNAISLEENKDVCFNTINATISSYFDTPACDFTEEENSFTPLPGRDVWFTKKIQASQRKTLTVAGLTHLWMGGAFPSVFIFQQDPAGLVVPQCTTQSNTTYSPTGMGLNVVVLSLEPTVDTTYYFGVSYTIYYGLSEGLLVEGNFTIRLSESPVV